MRPLPIMLAVVALVLSACQPAGADRDSSPAAPAPTTAKAIERAAPEAVSPGVSVHNLIYHCEDGRQVAARYDGERAFLTLDDRSLTLNIHPSASGVRYVGAGIQWWTRGMDQGQLTPLPEGATYEEPEAGVLCLSEDRLVPAPPPTGRR